METPQQMVKFKAYKRDGAPPTIDRRLTRVRNRSKMPLGAWAKWLVERILHVWGGGETGLGSLECAVQVVLGDISYVLSVPARVLEDVLSVMGFPNLY